MFEKLPAEESRRMDIAGYAIAILAIAAAALVWWGTRLVVIPEVLGVITVAVFSAAVLVAAWVAGTGPGFAATAFGTMTLLFLLSGPQHTLTAFAARDTAVIIAYAALAALITIVVGRLRSSSAALMRGLPEIERQARTRANEAAMRMVEEERRIAAAAKEDVADKQQMLQQWKSAAMRAADARAEYLAATRSAVRLPLRTIQRYAGRIGMGASGALTSSQQRDLDGIVSCEEHIATLIDSALTPARVEAGQLIPNMAEVSLSNVIAHASALVEPFLAAHGSSLECGNLDVPPVRADALILTQVLARLILEEARAGRDGFLRLEAKESGNGVRLECHALSNDNLTMATGGELVQGGGDDGDAAAWSSFAASQQVGRMGGLLTMGIADAETRFTVWLSTRPAYELQGVSGPVILWPPIAFEFPRG